MTILVIEHFNGKILIKQKIQNLQIMDVIFNDSSTYLQVFMGTVTPVNETRLVQPSSFLFLYEVQRFVTLDKNIISVFNFNGGMELRYETV